MNSELFEALDLLTQEKNIDRSALLIAITKSIKAACKKQFNHSRDGENHSHEADPDNIVVDINDVTGSFDVYADKTVVEEVEDELTQISLVSAKMLNPNYDLGDICRVPIQVKDFGRVVTKDAKDIIVQAIREQERMVLMREYEQKKEKIITATVQRYLPGSGNISLDLGSSEALLTEKEMIHIKSKDSRDQESETVEKFRPQQHIKVYVTEVRETNRGPKIILSRTHKDFVRKLFEEQVTEIHDGIVEIKAISREAGSRTKMAVWSNDPDVDPIGACVGEGGSRVNAVVNELGGEKIDIINWDENPAIFIENALSPAKVITVMGDPEERTCLVVVPDQQLSLAIGIKGQNVRLAARLTDFKIDIKSETQARESGDLLDYQEDYYEEDEDEFDDLFDEEDTEFDDEDSAEDIAEADGSNDEE